MNVCLNEKMINCMFECIQEIVCLWKCCSHCLCLHDTAAFNCSL